jgi:hypothetical protein
MLNKLMFSGPVLRGTCDLRLRLICEEINTARKAAYRATPRTVTAQRDI